MNISRKLLCNTQKLQNLLITGNITSKNPLVRYYPIKSDLKIKWVKPERIPSFKAEKSGDLEPMPSLDSSQIVPEFRNTKALEQANETVRRLFSLEFAPRKQTLLTYKENLRDSVKQHAYDVSSPEALIAKWTGSIRAMQEAMERHPRNKIMKVWLQELIDKRKKHLKVLRRLDYKRYEWLLENLNLVYKTIPALQAVTRKGSMRKLTNIYCDNVKAERLETYKKALQDEQPAFLEEKIRLLEFMRKEQQDLGAEVTIPQEEIDAVREQFVALKKEREAGDDKET